MPLRRLSQKLLQLYVAAGANTTSTEKLRKLASSRCDKIRMRVAENASTPSDVLAVLAEDHSADVRIAAATNRSTPLQAVQKVATDPDISIRHLIAQSINSPESVLNALREDENPWVRMEAEKTLQILRTWSGQELANARAQIKLDQSAFVRAISRRIGSARTLRTLSCFEILKAKKSRTLSGRSVIDNLTNSA